VAYFSGIGLKKRN